MRWRKKAKQMYNKPKRALQPKMKAFTKRFTNLF